MKRLLIFLLLAFLIISVAGCSITNPHIGKTFDYKWVDVCECESFPASCVIPTEHFKFEFEVRQLDTGEYEIEGEATIAEEKKTLGQIDSGTFTFLLGKEGVINEAVPVVVRGDLWSTVPFKKQFIPEADFDAIIVTYNIVYR